MQKVTDIGAFTAASRDIINQNFTQINADYYVDGQFGFDGNPGTSAGLAFKTMTPLTSKLPLFRAKSNQPIRIAISGVLTQEWSSPIVSDVTLIGAGNQPRQATTSGVPNGGGATWLSPTSGTGSLLTINGQAWTVQNIYFNNSATGATTGCVVLAGGGDPPLTADSAHTAIVGCFFTGEANGIYFNGPGYVTIENNVFQNFDSSNDCAILGTASGGGSGYGARIFRNEFRSNVIHLKLLEKARAAEVAYNRFTYIDSGVTTTTQIDFTGGQDNSVHNNYFDIPYSTDGITAMFVLGTNDRWYFNQFGTAVTTTIYSFGQPSS